MAKEKAQGTEVVNPQPSQELEVPKARVLAEVFAPNGKIRVELLPEGASGSAEGGSVDLQPLEKRVAALEKAPKGEGGGNSLGVYDKSVYTKVVNESELLSQLTSEQRGNYERLNRLCRAAFCWKNLSGIETGQDTAEKIVLEDGTVFQRLTDGKLNRDVGGLFDVYQVSFYNLSTLQKVDFLRSSLQNINKVFVAQVESDTEDLNEIIGGRFVGRFFRLEETNYTAEKVHTEDVVAIASDAKNLITDTRTLATNAKSTADEAKAAADGAKAAADKAKEVADNAKAKADEAKSTLRDLKHTVDGLVSDVESHTHYISENASEIRRVERIANEASVKLGKLSEGLVTDRFEISEGEEVRGDEEGNYLPLIFFHRVHSDVCINLGQGRFKLLNSGLYVQFYQDENDSSLWHERQSYTFMGGDVEENVLDYRVGENRRWRVVGRHPSSKSTREKVKELFGL